MRKIDYQALREAAQLATQGEWVAFISSGTGTYAVHTPGDKRCEDVIKWTGFDGQKNAENNARYIAAFNPEVVQALLDERERNQQYIKRRDQENEEIALTVGKLRVDLEAAEALNKHLELAIRKAEGCSEALRRKTEAAEKRIAELEAREVVPDEMTPKQASRSYCGEVRGYRDGWNACRAKVIGNMFLSDMDRAATDNTNQQFESLSRGDK